MKASEASFLSFLKKSFQFIIPIYQRTYSWSESECKQLWDDILKAGSDNNVSVHFIGSIVYIEEGQSQVSHQSPLLAIDGQQRLTTLTLLIEALACAVGDKEPIDGFSARKLRNYYLQNPEESGDRHFKLLLSQTDRATLKAIVSGVERPLDGSIKIAQNFELFKKLTDGAGEQIAVVCKGLSKLFVIDVSLTRGQDDPQLIFESMNSTGKELSQADLIRNFVLMKLKPEFQTRLYDQYWHPMEIEFGQEAYGTQFDAFVRHFLTMKTGTIPKVDEVYQSFKLYFPSKNQDEKSLEVLVEDLRRFARYFCAMALGKETDEELNLAFHDLRELRVDVAYPFLLELYDDYSKKILSKKEFLEAVRLIESYVFRRAVCAIPTNSMNKTFAGFSKALNKERYFESIQAHFLLLKSYRRLPDDAEFERDLQTRNLYSFRNRSYSLRRLENYGRKERVEVDQYTIEHIMPQNEKVSPAWRSALGADWKRVHQTWLHTLGNLTLTGYNAEYSDRAFEDKRDMKGGFKESPLQLNSGLGAIGTWNEGEIEKRGARLVKLASKLWSVPELADSVLDLYKPKSEANSSYSIEDHPYLLTSPMRELFAALRAEVLALDPCVSEEVLAKYIAYKAETNFVDVVPQAKQLRLSLNIDFADVHDPNKMSKDVTNLGHWGNGNTELRLSSIDQLPYVMGLVRQALELQMDDAKVA